MAATKEQLRVTDTWRRFKQTGEQTWRNRLMEHYLHIVKYNADRIAAKLPDEVDGDDLVSAGVFGLMDAIESFDLQRGVKFETFCAQRIRGAIIDELRSMDWVPRLVRTRAHTLERVTRELEVLLGRTPVESEIQERLRLPQEQFEKLLRDATAVTQISLSRSYNDNDSNKDVTEMDVIPDRRGRDPVKELERRDLKELMTRGLSRAERLILILYYYEEMTMKEIGLTLDLSESRVSQMHSAVLERLKTQLANRRRELTQ